jgi:hypothetical protein
MESPASEGKRRTPASIMKHISLPPLYPSEYAIAVFKRRKSNVAAHGWRDPTRCELGKRAGELGTVRYMRKRRDAGGNAQERQVSSQA